MATSPILKSSKTNSTYNIKTGELSNGPTVYAPNTVLRNTDAQNQVLANANPQAFDVAANMAGFSNFPVSQSNIPSVVPVSGLSATPVNLMPTQVPTAAVGGIAALGQQALSVQDQFLQQQQAQLASQQNQVTTQQNGIADVYTRLFGQANRNEDIYKDLGVDDAQKAVNNYTSQIEQEQLANRRQIEELQKNPNGMTAQALSATTQEVNRKSLSQQADLAVLQGAAARNFDAVSSAADRKIAAETEGLKLELQARQFFYQENKEDYNKTEQRIYEQQNKKIETEIKNKENGQKMIVEAVSFGAPNAVIQQAQAAYNNGASPTEIARIIGTYTPAGLAAQTERLQQQNIRSQIAERQQAGNAAGTINGKPQNATQATANTYANRLAEANVTLDTLGGKFTGVGTAIGNVLGGLVPNFLKGGDRQAVEQAQKNFVTAILRRESGASIAPTEFQTAAEIYFPQPGDKPEVVQQKAITRNSAINNFYKEANAFRPVLPGQIIQS